MVHDREYGVIPMARRELGDQVHGYYLEWNCRRRYWDVVLGCGSLWEVLVLLTDRASLDVLPNPSVHAYPVVVC